MSEKIYRPVNWLNGMNINQSHFVTEQMSNLHYQMSVQENQITPFNYGLFAHGEGYQLWMDMNDNLEVNVELSNVSILFPGGYFLTLEGRNEELNVFDAQIDKDAVVDEYAVVLSINMDERVPFGQPDSNEIPIRKPFVIPGIHLSVVAMGRYKEELHGQQYIVIGRLVKDGEAWGMDNNYIPPVQKVAGLSILVKQHHMFENHLSSIERSTIDIIQKIRQKKQDNELATILLDISIKLNEFLVGVITDFKSCGLYNHPVDLFVPFMKMARLIQNVLDTWQGCGKDEMMTYLSDWCDISEGEFENMIRDMITHKYNHNDINRSVQLTTHFADVVSSMFTVLASLDFVGKKIDANLFVAEEQESLFVEEEGTTKKKKRFNLLRS